MTNCKWIDRYWAGAFLLFLLTVGVYQKALWFVPASGDDLRILSSVSQTDKPLSYFVNDWGMKNTYRLANGQVDTRRRSYRPLHSISIWLGYRMFGISAFPNQLLNLGLHFLNAALLLRILSRLGIDSFLVLLLTMLSLVSMYTASPAIWVSDRQTLVVALAALILLDHVVDANGRLKGSVNLWLVTGLTIIAVLFQESGLIIPLMAAAIVALGPNARSRWRSLVVCALLVVSYLGLRIWLFGSNAFAYASEGFVFGTKPYTLLSELPWQIGLWARCENVAKNFICVFFPIINPVGRVNTPKDLIADLFWWLPTLVLAVSVTRRPLAKLQWLALAVILLNALLHVQVFRYRVEYISELAFCLYIGASLIWRSDVGKDHANSRQRVAAACCGIIAVVSISQVNHYIHSNWVERQDELTKRHLTTITQNYPISDRIVHQVFGRYALPETKTW